MTANFGWRSGLVMAGVMLLAVSSVSRADNVQLTGNSGGTLMFHDTTEAPSISMSGFLGGEINNATCDTENEVCSFELFRNGVYIVGMQGPSGEDVLFDGSWTTAAVLDPPNSPEAGQLSDQFWFWGGNNGNGGLVNVYLYSDKEVGPQDPCFNLDGCAGDNPPLAPIVETGLTQEALRVLWSDGRLDIFNFASDVESVPEPASLVLLGIGLVAGARQLGKRRTKS